MTTERDTIAEENQRRSFTQIAMVDGKRVVAVIDPNSQRSWTRQVEAALKRYKLRRRTS